jgi:hypothetical protein
MGTHLQTPVRTLISSQWSEHRLRRVDERTLVLEPKLDARAAASGGLVFALLGVLAGSACLAAGVPPVGAGWIAAIFGAAALACAVVPPLISPLWMRAAIDLDLGTIRLSGWRFPGRPTVRIDAIRAIQLCEAGRAGDPDGWESYQVNLALFGPSDERINLLDCGDADALRRIGDDLSRSLGVPLVDLCIPRGRP